MFSALVTWIKNISSDSFAMLDFSVAPFIIRMAFIFISSNLARLVSYVPNYITIFHHLSNK